MVRKTMAWMLIHSACCAPSSNRIRGDFEFPLKKFRIGRGFIDSKMFYVVESRAERVLKTTDMPTSPDWSRIGPHEAYFKCAKFELDEFLKIHDIPTSPDWSRISTDPIGVELALMMHNFMRGHFATHVFENLLPAFRRR